MAEAMKITKVKALELMAEAVTEKGDDYTYPLHERNYSCRYVNEGQPDCLVGNALHRAGVSIETLKEMDDDSDPWAELGISSERVQGILKPFVTFTPAAVAALTEAQSSQDNGHAWGRALDCAKRARA